MHVMSWRYSGRKQVESKQQQNLPFWLDSQSRSSRWVTMTNAAQVARMTSFTARSTTTVLKRLGLWVGAAMEKTEKISIVSKLILCLRTRWSKTG